ncbi:gag-pol polyprotein [Hordeum vulgare]|nr:gag-pol polyprotein [Hordeum vulgare]
MRSQSCGLAESIKYVDDFTTYLGIFAKRLQGIFAFGYVASSLTSISREAYQAKVRDFHNLLRLRHRLRDSILLDSRPRRVPRVGVQDGHLPQEIQVPYGDQVKCTTRNFHDYASALNSDIAKTIFTNTYKSLDDLYFGALKAEQELKAKPTRPRAHFTVTKIHDYKHEDGTTKMSKPNELQDDAPKSDFTAIPLCSIYYDKSSMTLFEDDVTTMTTESLKEHASEVSDKVACKDDASIFGGECDDVPYLAFINDNGDDMVEHGISF